MHIDETQRLVTEIEMLKVVQNIVAKILLLSCGVKKRKIWGGGDHEISIFRSSDILHSLGLNLQRCCLLDNLELTHIFLLKHGRYCLMDMHFVRISHY